MKLRFTPSERRDQWSNGQRVFQYVLVPCPECKDEEAHIAYYYDEDDEYAIDCFECQTTYHAPATDTPDPFHIESTFRVIIER